MRLFIGIKLDNSSVRKINNYFNYLYSENITGNYTSLNNLHLTLAFLGELDESKVDELIGVINSLSLDFNQIKITRLTKLKDMLIGEVEKEDSLMKLQEKLIKKLDELKFKIDKKEFYPHITLIRKVENLKPLKIICSDLEIISKVEKITLFESNRINGKLVYIPKN